MRELILTGKEEFWPIAENEKNALFLSIACFAFNKKYCLEEAENRFEITSSPFSNSGDFIAAYDYTNKLLFKIQPVLARLLNKLYETEFSERFWNIITSRWLLHFIEVTYVHYLSLLKVGEYNEIFTVKIPSNPLQLSSVDYEIIMINAHLHDYNLCLLAQIIEHGGFKFLKTSNVNIDLNWKFAAHKYRLSLRKKICRSLFPSDVVLGHIYGFSREDIFKLRIAKLSLPYHKGKWNAISLKNKLCSASSIDFNPSNEFEFILSQILVDNIPRSWLSGIPQQEIHLRKKYWIGNDIWLGFEHAAAIARIVENGGKWYSVQHGGAYTQLRCFPQEQIEFYLTDGFISWGNNANIGQNKRLKPLPSPMLSKLPKRSKTGNNIVYIGNSAPMYYYRLQHFFQPTHRVEYFKSRARFIQYLRNNISKELLCRPYLHHDYGDGDIKLLKNDVTESQIYYSDHASLFNKISQSRLCVIDHSATSILEVACMDVPMVWFWDPKQFVFIDDAQKELEKLEAVSIYHRTPESAAAHVNKFYDDVDSWWMRDDVQSARKEFCRKYAWAEKNYIDYWTEFMRKL